MGVFDNLRQRRQERRAYNESDAAALEPYRENAFTVGSVFGAAGRQRAAARQQEVLSRYLNEEIAAQVGDSTSADMTVVIPQAYFSAARRVAEINPAASQQLYQAGLQAQLAAEKHKADITEKLRVAEPRADTDAALVRLNRMLELDPTLKDRPEEQAQFLREFGLNSADVQRLRIGDTRPGARGDIIDFNVEDTANRVAATQAIETLPELKKTAEAGATGIEAIRGAVDMLNEGVRTGTAANMRQWFARAMATLSGQPVDEQAIVDNTDAYLGAISPLVFARVTALRPVTQEERSYVEQMAGGDIALTEGSLRKLLDIAYKANLRDINGYNRNRDYLSGNPTYGSAIAGAFPSVGTPSPVNFARPEVIPTFATAAEAEAAAAAGTIKIGDKIRVGDQMGTWK